jgi:hypothetical protein
LGKNIWTPPFLSAVHEFWFGPWYLVDFITPLLGIRFTIMITFHWDANMVLVL